MTIHLALTLVAAVSATIAACLGLFGYVLREWRQHHVDQRDKKIEFAERVGRAIARAGFLQRLASDLCSTLGGSEADRPPHAYFFYRRLTDAMHVVTDAKSDLEQPDRQVQIALGRSFPSSADFYHLATIEQHIETVSALVDQATAVLIQISTFQKSRASANS